MKASELQRSVIDMGRRLGWRVAHFPAVQDVHGVWRTPVAADGKGFPDLILVRDRVVAMEVKGGGHKPRPEQQDWMRAFQLAGVDTLVVTPKVWQSGAVEAVLSRRGGP